MHVLEKWGFLEDLTQIMHNSDGQFLKIWKFRHKMLKLKTILEWVKKSRYSDTDEIIHRFASAKRKFSFIV